MKRTMVALALVLGLVGSGTGATRSSILPSGPAAEWRFSEGSGTSAADSSGSGFTGTLTNGPAWTTGRLGSGLSFDGANDYVNLGTNVNLVNNVPAATVALWIRPGSTLLSGSFRELVSISVASGAATNTSRIALSLQGDGTAGDLFAGARSNDTEAQKTLSGNANLTVGTWAHVAAVYDFAGNSIKVFLNGNLIATNAAAGFAAAATPNTASRSLALGAQDTGDSNYYHGQLDEVRIYRRALAASEIQTLAAADALQARLSFDEGAGTAAVDASENALAGTLRNGAAWTAGIMGNALHFDGTNDSVDLGSNLPLLRNTNAATVSAWIRPGSVIPAGTFREIVSISVNAGSPTNVSRLALSLQGDGTGGDIFVGARSTEAESQKNLVANTNLTPGTWVHVVGVVDFAQGTLSIYLNGTLVASGPAAFVQSHTPNTPATNGALGAQDTGDSNFFHGDLDEVRVYGRALTACEVSDLAMKDGLHLLLKMDEGTGTTAADSSGHGLNGTLKNGAAWGAGQFGSAVGFDGVNDYVDLGTNLDPLAAANGATLATWVKLSSLPASGAFRDLVSISVNSPGGPTDTSRAVLSLVGDGTAADIFTGGRSTDTEAQQTLTADANLASGTWYHLAAVIDFSHNTLAVYKNGALVSSGPATFSQPTTPSTLSTNAALGSQDRGDGNFFHGFMDEVRVYCRALSGAEVAALAAPGVPAAPTLLQAVGGDARVDLQWTSVAGATSYNVKRGPSISGPFTTIANVGTTTYTDLTVTNGTPYAYEVSAQNAAGEGPDSNKLTATPNPPATLPPPAIVSPVGPINTATPTVTGTSSSPGLTITLYVDGAANGTATSAIAGNWSIVPPNALSAGAHTLTAKSFNGTTTSAASAGVSITVDTTAPVISNPAPAAGSTVFTATPAISASWSDSGTGISVATASISLDGSTVAGATITASGFSFTPAALAEGSHTVNAQIQDAAGNPAALSWSFSVLLPPSPPTITSPTQGQVLATHGPTVTGTSTASGLTITLYVDGFASGTITSGAGGAWSLVPAAFLADGTRTLTATASNAAGPSAPSAPITVLIDTTIPVILNPSPAPGTTVTTATPVISASWSDTGSGIVPGTASITLDGAAVSGATVTSTGFSFQPTLSAGSHTVAAQVSDGAGNIGSASWSFTVLLPPSPPAITSPAAGAMLITGSPLVSGTSSQSGLTISLFVDGTARGTATSGAGGAWSLTPSAAMGDGTHTLTATASNAAGTSAASPGISVTVDTNTPVIGTFSPAPGSTVTVANPTVSASWTDVTSGINVSSAAITLDGSSVTGASVSTFGFSFTTSGLSNGTHSVSVQIRDIAGHPASASWSFTVDVPASDTTAPTISGVTPANGSFVNIAYPSISASIADTGGSGIDAASVAVVLNSVVIPSSVSFSDPNTATVTATPPTLAEGAQFLVIDASDLAGNAATPATSSFTVDVSIPVIDSSAPVDGTSYPTTTISLDVTLRDDVSGIAAGSIQVLLNQANVTSTVTITDQAGPPPSTRLQATLAAATGSNALEISVADAAGNLASRTIPFNVGSTPPPITQIHFSPPPVDIELDSILHQGHLPLGTLRTLTIKVKATQYGVPVPGIMLEGIIEEGEGFLFKPADFGDETDPEGFGAIGFLASDTPSPSVKVRVVPANAPRGATALAEFYTVPTGIHADVDAGNAGSMQRAFITLNEDVGGTGVIVEETNAAGDPLTDPSARKLDIQTPVVYTVPGKSYATLLYKIKDGMTGTAYFKATGLEFRTLTEQKPIYSVEPVAILGDGDGKVLIESGNEQVGLPSQELDDEIVFQPVRIVPTPGFDQYGVFVTLESPWDTAGTLDTGTKGTLVFKDATQIAMRVDGAGKCSIKFTPSATGGLAKMRVVTFERRATDPPGFVAPMGRSNTVIVNPVLFRLVAASGPGGRTSAIPSVSTTPWSEILSNPGGIGDDRRMYIEAELPKSVAAAPTVWLNALDVGQKDMVTPGTSVPPCFDIMTLVASGTAGTWRSQFPVVVTYSAGFRIPAGLPYTVLRMGQFLKLGNPIYPSSDVVIPAALKPILSPPILTSKLFVDTGNGRYNARAADLVKITLWSEKHLNGTIRGDQSTVVGNFIFDQDDGAGDRTQSAFQTGAAKLKSLKFQFNAPTAAIQDSDLTFTLTNGGGPPSIYIVPVRLIRRVATLRIMYNYAINNADGVPIEGFDDADKARMSAQITRVHRLAQEIYTQAGVDLQDVSESARAGAVGPFDSIWDRIFVLPPSNVLVYVEPDPDARLYFARLAGDNYPNADFTFLFVNRLVTTTFGEVFGLANFNSTTNTGVLSLVVKQTLSLYDGEPYSTVAHELGHNLGLSLSTVTVPNRHVQNPALIADRALQDLAFKCLEYGGGRVGNHIPNLDIPLVSGETQQQLNIVRTRAAGVEAVRP